GRSRLFESFGLGADARRRTRKFGLRLLRTRVYYYFPRIRRRSFEFGVDFTTTRSPDRSYSPLSGGHSHFADIRRRLFQHGQRFERDGRRTGRHGLLQPSH
uniref:Uncharacterized protein n=1 Tax=Romanomermis culicivorax TaxID=13658 RepID=A0A915KQ60_ROMCU